MVSLLLEWRADIGSWRGIVTLPTGIGGETNGANNTASITVVVAPAPDLAPTISGPTTLALDQRETYTFQIANGLRDTRGRTRPESVAHAVPVTGRSLGAVLWLEASSRNLHCRCVRRR